MVRNDAVLKLIFYILFLVFCSLSSSKHKCVFNFLHCLPYFVQVGDQIVLSTTSYDPWQTETRTITAVLNNNLTLTLDQPLEYTHIG